MVGPKRELKVSLLKTIKRRVYPTASQYIIRAELVEGVLKNTDKPFRCLFADNSPFTHYLLRKIFAEPVRIIKKRRIWIPALKKMLHSSAEDMDLCIAVLPRRYEPEFRGLYTFRGQEFVRQIIDTSGTWDDVRKRFHRKKREISNNLAGKYGLSSRISTDEKDFDFFYHRMFLPHIKKRFRDFSVIDSYEEMKHFFAKGFLLLIMSGDQAVAGSLCLVKDLALVFRRAGVLDGNDDYIKGGAQMAIYYFQLRLAKEYNLGRMDAMSSRPFLDDGVYRTKREWGAAVYPDHDSNCWVYYFIPRRSKRVVSFFESSPAIVQSGDGLIGVVGSNGCTEPSDQTRKDLVKRFYAPGLEGLLLLSPYPSPPVVFPFKDYKPSNH
ncbi:MAG: hypothetical protein M1510_14465 [Nitrospirae bacterium]|nr:hypothetical protein [Nitrospirota bacterium]MCL5237690.1 hypothetical protein [Nitrospirota bacterium]